MVDKRCEPYVGIANSNNDISCYDGPMKIVDGSLESRRRALSVDVTTLILGLIPVVLMAFEYGESW